MTTEISVTQPFDVQVGDAEKPNGGQAISNMTLRDWFAGQAMASLCLQYSDPLFLADRAYKYADAMIAQRKK